MTGGLVPGRVTEVTTGLAMPWGLTFLPDGSALVSGRASAEIRHVPPGGGPAALVGVVPGVAVTAEGGLLGLAASPGFADDRTVYAYVSAAPSNRVVALRLAEDLRSLTVARVVLEGIPTADRHHGGRLQFGPDGHLWVTTGDAYTTREIAPDPNSLGGKVLRIRPDGTVPPDSPFGSPVFTTGHRNVQGIAFGPDAPRTRPSSARTPGTSSTCSAPAPTTAGRRPRDPTATAGSARSSGSRRPAPPPPASPTPAARSGWPACAAAAVAPARRRRTRHRRSHRPPRRRVRAAADRARPPPDGTLWVTTSNTDRATLGGEPARSGDDRILRIELVPATGADG